MAKLTFQVPNEWDGKRLDRFLRTVHGMTGTTLKGARRREGGLTMDGLHLRTIDAVHAGATVVVDIGDEARIYAPCTRVVPVCYEDESLVVFEKPAGMVSHPSLGHPIDTLANVFAARNETAGLVYRPMGRLDRDTSGLVAVAKHAHAAAVLPPHIQKQYLAVAGGAFARHDGVVDAPIGQTEDQPRREILPDGKPALTRYRVLLESAVCSLVLVEPETGRTHQIRVHMASIGHPLAGDALYGGNAQLCVRQALHCWRMRIENYPQRSEMLRLEAPLPSDFLAPLLRHFPQEALDAALDNCGIIKQ